MRQARRQLRGSWRRGTSMIEAAIVLPVLLWITLGSVEVGHFFYVKQMLQSASRDGARAAILIGADNASITRAVERTMVSAGIPTTRYTVSVVQVNKDTLAESAVVVSTAATSTPLKVTVTCTWGNVGIRPSPVPAISATKLVTGATVMVKE